MTDPVTGRRSFGPVVLLGLAAGTLAAVAGSKPWVAVATTEAADAADYAGWSGDAGEMPLAAALALVVLACWGVLLVTRGTVRRVVAALGALAAAGVVATVVAGGLTLDDDLRDSVASLAGGDPSTVGHTAWFWAAAAGAVLSLAATTTAVLLAPHWPEMGRRYDAPAAGREAAERPPGEQSSLDLWKSIDEGRDPTA